MTSKAIAFFLAASALAALLLLPAGAGARPKPASRQQPPEVSEVLALFGTNGFRVGVTVKNRRRLSVVAIRLGGAIEAVTYQLNSRQARGSDDIVARLGTLGRVDVRFVPSKVRREKPPRGCHGHRIIIEEGHYVGLIAFHGEHGYTQVSADRAPGAVTRRPALRCAPIAPFPHKKPKPEPQTPEGTEEGEGEQEDDGSLSVRLNATARGHKVTLKASKAILKNKTGKGFSLTNFSLTGTRRRGRMKESSIVALLFERGSTILVPDRRHPTSEAIVKPPAPFTGSATFRRHPAKPPTWTGDLKVTLPGFGIVPLAGPGTRATMCATLSCFH